MTLEDKRPTDQEIISVLRACMHEVECDACQNYPWCKSDAERYFTAAADRLEELTAALPKQSPKELALYYLGKETREIKNRLWSAIERKAPQIDIENLRRKQVALDWLTGVAIKESDETR